MPRPRMVWILGVFWWTSTHEKIFDLTNTNANWSTYRLPTNNPFYLGSGYPFWISLITASICLFGSLDLAVSLINAWMCFGNLLNIRSIREWVWLLPSHLSIVSSSAPYPMIWHMKNTFVQSILLSSPFFRSDRSGVVETILVSSGGLSSLILL